MKTQFIVLALSCLLTINNVDAKNIIDVFAPLLNATAEWLPKLLGAQDIKDDMKLLSARPHYLIERAKFQYVEHDVITSDGYILQILHLINPLADPTRLRRPPVVIFCPLLVNLSIYLFQDNDKTRPIPYPSDYRADSSENFNDVIGNVSRRAIPFALANAGFDVWLASTRGADRDNARTIHGNYLNVTNYWEFSIDQFANIDVPTVVDLVLKRTECKQLIYIGFSQSTLTMFARLSAKPSFALKIHTFVAIGPTVRLRHAGGLLPLLKATVLPIIKDPILKKGALLTPETAHAINALVYMGYARFVDFTKTLLKVVLNLLFGVSGPPNHTNIEAALTGVFPACIGGWQVLHWAQLIGNENVCAFDYGRDINLKKYGRTKPPIYDMSRIKLDNSIVLFLGTNDVLATTEDYLWLKKNLKVKFYYEKILKSYNHADMVLGFNLAEDLVDPLIEVLIERTIE